MSHESPPKPSAPPPVCIRFGEMEDEVTAAMKASGTTNRSEFVRSALRHFLAGRDSRSAAALEELTAELAGLRRDFAPVGSNLNQIAYAYHRKGSVDHAALARNHFAMQEQFKGMAKLLRKVLHELERQG